MTHNNEREAMVDIAQEGSEYNYIAGINGIERDDLGAFAEQAVAGCLSGNCTQWPQIKELAAKYLELRAALSNAVPDGYIVVPREPTEAMCKAADDAEDNLRTHGEGVSLSYYSLDKGNKHINAWSKPYKAMIAAAEKGGI